MCRRACGIGGLLRPVALPPRFPRTIHHQAKEASAASIAIAAVGLARLSPASCTVTQIIGGITNLLMRVDFPPSTGMGPVLVRRFGAVGMIDREVENALFGRSLEGG